MWLSLELPSGSRAVAHVSISVDATKNLLALYEVGMADVSRGKGSRSDPILVSLLPEMSLSDVVGPSSEISEAMDDSGNKFLARGSVRSPTEYTDEEYGLDFMISLDANLARLAREKKIATQ